MPQENQVLRCFSCETFQVHLVKKVKKWECKLCGAKQSFKRHYGKGSGKDCRNHVMKLNELRLTNVDSQNLADEIAEDIPQEEQPTPVQEKKGSKWAQYLDHDDSEQETFYKPEKKRKISEEFDDVIKACKESDANRIPHVKSNNTQDSKNSEHQNDTTERKKSKNIFDSDLDNFDFLSFI